jgi:YtcA family
MNSKRESFERSSNARSLWMCLVTSAFVLGTAGCSAPPMFNILGSYFPSWLVCLGISIGLTFLAHVFVTTRKLADQLWPLPIIYSALVCFLSCTLWLTFFD